MEQIQTMKDSVKTSVSLKLFKSEKESSYAHIFKSKYATFPMASCKDDLDNFNPARLSEDPYPDHDRPRGKADLDSIKHHRKYIAFHGSIAEPIWIARKNGKYILLDGAHRIVSTYLEHKRTIPAYIVQLD